MGREYGVAGARSPETFFQVCSFPVAGKLHAFGRNGKYILSLGTGKGNIEQLAEENRTALLHISQNGNAKIVFTHYALSVSKLIGRRQ